MPFTAVKQYKVRQRQKLCVSFQKRTLFNLFFLLKRVSETSVYDLTHSRVIVRTLKRFYLEYSVFTFMIFDPACGQISAIVVPSASGLFGMFSREGCIIPWSCIETLGEDYILVRYRPK